MSTYATIEGTVHYKTEQDYQKAVTFLREGGWVDEGGHFTDEADEPIRPESDPAIHPDTHSISIPRGVYRNLVRHIGPGEPLTEGAASGGIVYTCTDGVESCGRVTITNGEAVEEEHDLMEWAAENAFEEDETIPDIDEDFDAYVEMQSAAETYWFDHCSRSMTC